MIHSYVSGWKGADVVSDDVVAGFFPWLIEAQKVFDVHVFSSRSGHKGGITAMIDWLYGEIRRIVKHENVSTADCAAWVDAVDGLYWPTSKPPAFLTLDDRALQFQGVWPDVERLQEFKPWNK